MRILVTAASKHGATDEIARVIADVLAEGGHEVVVQPADIVERLGGFDAAVIGSAVYAGHWLPAASQLIEREATILAGIPVWLFSSGPIGDPPKPADDPVDIERHVEATGARAQRVFAGRLDRSTMGFAERAICAALRAPEGDFRPWPEIRSWAAGIAETLAREPVRIAPGGGFGR